MNKLRLEITSALEGKDTITRNDIKQLDYLTNVLKESTYTSVHLLHGLTYDLP